MPKKHIKNHLPKGHPYLNHPFKVLTCLNLRFNQLSHHFSHHFICVIFITQCNRIWGSSWVFVRLSSVTIEHFVKSTNAP